MNANDVDMRKVNRLEVIDEDGRSYVNWQDKALGIEMSLQDEGRTIKIYTKGSSSVSAAKEEQAKVEPVAWMTEQSGTIISAKEYDKTEAAWKKVYNIPLYTHPTPAPASGLTVEDVMKVFYACAKEDDHNDYNALRFSTFHKAFRKAIEGLAENGGGNLRTDAPHNT